MKNYFYLILFLIMSNATFAQTSWRDFYDILPNIENCNSGKIKDSEQQKLLTEINAIRALHGLQPLVYKADGFQQAMDAALISVANGSLNHYPPTTAFCYSKSGYDGSATSNLHLSSNLNEYIYPSINAVDGWLIDNYSLNAKTSAGHRRAVLNPFVNGVAFGRVDGNSKVSGKENIFYIGMAMKYDYYSSKATGLVNDYVAYPYQNYPIKLVDKKFFLSFMAVADKNSLWNNQKVDFSGTTITMTTESGTAVGVSEIHFDNVAWGSYPNAIHWKGANLADNVKYFVEIKNVKFNNVAKDYSYWFKLTNDPLPDPDILATPILEYPTNLSVDIPIDVNLKWKTVQDAESYEVYFSDVADNLSNVQPIKVTTNVTNVNQLIKGKKYYWKVRAKKGENYSDYSAIYSFTTIKSTTPPPAQFSIISPANNETDVDLFPKLIWTKKEGAYYDLQVNNSIDFSNENFLTVNEKNYKDTTYQFTKELYKKGIYYWRVRYKLPTLSGEWTPAAKFTTGNITSIEIIDVSQSKLSQFSIIPNPVSSNQFNFSFNSNEVSEYKIAIHTILGKTVLDDFRIISRNKYYTIKYKFKFWGLFLGNF